MEQRTLLDMLYVAQRLKDVTRHCDTVGGRRESVAEHSWRLALMVFWLKPEFPALDMDKVVSMCLIHDLGECFTGDIPVFDKTDEHRRIEESLLNAWVDTLPEPTRSEMAALYTEMSAQQTPEAKLYKALDGLEALISHNEADISTWEPHEYDLQLQYCNDRVTFSDYLTKLREEIRQDSVEKIHRSSGE